MLKDGQKMSPTLQEKENFGKKRRKRGGEKSSLSQILFLLPLPFAGYI